MTSQCKKIYQLKNNENKILQFGKKNYFKFKIKKSSLGLSRKEFPMKSSSNNKMIDLFDFSYVWKYNKENNKFRSINLHSSMAVVETCPINFMMRYGVANIKLKNVRIGHAETFFGALVSDPAGSCVPFAAAEKISLNRAVDGSALLKPSKYNNLKSKNKKRMKKNQYLNTKKSQLNDLLSVKPGNTSYQCECGPKLCKNPAQLAYIGCNA